ncbi:MAG TPA: heavy metal translocating P-type ATPase, partial [Planctomycetaceae bacterium]|nr:heavy metal translocating P-type ATPase [Planctomycetaceae bacterium]
MTGSHDASAQCAYCGLPLAGSLWKPAAPAEHAEAEYCCLGCRLAAQVTSERGEAGAAQWTLVRLGFAIFCTMNVVMFTMVLWSHDVYESDQSALQSSLDELCRYGALVTSVPVLLILGGPLWESTLRELRRGRVATDLLLLAGVLASYVYSAISVVRGAGHVYFEVGCLVLVMTTLGRWFEAVGKLRATSALDSLSRLLPERVRRLHGPVETSIPLDEILIGDHVRVLAGERFPTDGRLVEPALSADEQLFTGESWPIEKQPGDRILGGTLNLDADAEIEVEAAPRAGTFGRLLDAVQKARTAKGRYERLADRVAAWFTPAVAVIALVAAGVRGYSDGTEAGLLTGLSVLLIACPCALGLATPLAVWGALGRAAEAQVLFRSGEALEQLAGVRAIAFDKTGTLTTGAADVARFLVLPHEREEVTRAAAALVAGSTHTLSRAIRHWLQSTFEPESFVVPSEFEWTEISAIRTRAGRGVVGLRFDGKLVGLGSLRLMRELGCELPEEWEAFLAATENAQRPLACIGWNGRVRGVFLFDEQLRPEVLQVLPELRDLGCRLQVLTGDRRICGQRLQQTLGIPVQSELLPEDKVEALCELRRTTGATAMVGDGINDAPSLAAADVGIALGCGTDVARDSAEVCLLSNDLARIPWAIRLAQRT